jgi:hypothetical protein
MTAEPVLGDETRPYIPGLVRRRPALVASAVLFIAAFALYVSTMAPGLTWENEGGDGGDFLAAAHTWGIPHPTGYPTYIVLLRSFSELIWFGDEASRANLFSALAGALAVPFFFLAARKLLLRLPVSDTRGRALPFAAAFVTAFAFAASNLHWSQSTITEVYALNAMFGALFLWLALIAKSRTDRGGRALGVRTVMALLFGVALGNHVTISFVAVPVGVWIYWPLVRSGGRRTLREWQPIVGLLAGLAVYAYAPIASAQDPALNWFFPSTFSGFRSMSSASLYQPYVFGLAPELFYDRIIAIFDIWLTQFTALGAILGLAGMMFLWGRRRGFAIAGLTSVLALVIYTIAYNSFDSYVFLVPAIMVFGLWISAGLLNLAVSLAALAEQSQKRWVNLNKSRIAPLVIAVAIIGMPVWSVAFNYDGVDISDDSEAREYVVTAFDVAGAGAVIIAEDIPTFSLWYQALVVEPEQDVAIIATFLLDFDWYWEHIQRQFPDRVPAQDIFGSTPRLRAIVLNNLGHTPVFLTREDASYSVLFSLAEAGPLWRVEG